MMCLCWCFLLFAILAVADLESERLQGKMQMNWGQTSFRNTWCRYGSIPIDTFLVGWTSIYQLFWGSLGTRVLTHNHVFWFHAKSHGMPCEGWCFPKLYIPAAAIDQNHPCFHSVCANWSAQEMPLYTWTGWNHMQPTWGCRIIAIT